MKRSFNPEKEIARYIILAQTASDAGKGIEFRYIERNCTRGAQKFGYDAKLWYILKAISLIRTCDQSMFRYYVTGNTPDQNGYDSVLVYFDVKLKGERRQISFHTPWSEAEGSPLKLLMGSGRKTRWDGKVGGSSDTCYDLAEYFKFR